MGQHGGVILNMASTAGLQADQGLAAYGASKAGLLQMTRELALELAPAIRVNAIAPAVIKTQFAASLVGAHEREVARTYPLNRLGTSDDVAGAAAFLLSDDASWITGQREFQRVPVVIRNRRKKTVIGSCPAPPYREDRLCGFREALCQPGVTVVVADARQVPEVFRSRQRAEQVTHPSRMPQCAIR